MCGRGPESYTTPHTHTKRVAGDGSAGQKDHLPFTAPPVSYHHHSPQPLHSSSSTSGRGRFVSTVLQDRPTNSTLALFCWPNQDRIMVWSARKPHPSLFSSVQTPATSFPMFALLLSCPVIHSLGTHYRWHVTALFVHGFACRSLKPWELHCRSHTPPSLVLLALDGPISGRPNSPVPRGWSRPGHCRIRP